MYRLAFYRTNSKGVRYIVGTLSELRAFLQQPGVRYASDPYNPPQIAAEYEGRKRGVLPTPRKNPARPAAKHKRAARSMVQRYGKPRARKVAGGMIGVARTRKQREHFVKVRRAINPKMPITPEDRGILRAMVKEHGVAAVRAAVPGAKRVRIAVGPRSKRDFHPAARRAKRQNPVRITSPRGGSREFRVYARNRGSSVWSLIVKTNSLKHALKNVKTMERSGRRVRLTEVK